MTKTRALKYATLLSTGAVFFVFAWGNVQATRLGYNIEELRKEIKVLETGNKYLKKEIQLSMSPERLQAEAVKLGLVYPEPDTIVLLEEKATDKPAKGWLARLF
ncbi:MAG: hypothetical protein HY796_07445 [Elusimicrobia bacterium]|nr:hypothetical protein [Elusimicrobiota bacterium]